jgi:hypothetical protein
MSTIDDEIVLAHFIVSDDVERSRRFYTDVLGSGVAFSGPGGLTYVALSNSWSYTRDPDGHLIEVGQTTDPDGDWTPTQWRSRTDGGESE